MTNLDGWMLDGLDIFGLWAFLTLGHGEANLLAFSQGFETWTWNSTEVSENIRTRFLLNEAEAFSFVKPFYGASSSFRHDITCIQK